MAKASLDFIVIGAQKSGTTSLFEYLRLHPQIHIPRGKEVEFFSNDTRYKQGWDGYVREFFSDAHEEALWGTVSPQYMSDPLVPERIHNTMPGAKLIALLRNPVYRALSHYKHAVREGFESRSFDRVVSELVAHDRALHARQLRVSGVFGSTESYLVRGEYARILSLYRGVFPKEQISVLFSDELEHAPQETYRRILEFLEVSTGFLPGNLGERYHIGGTKQRIPSAEKLAKNKLLRRLWRTMPGRTRLVYTHVYAKISHWSTVPDSPTNSTEIESQTLARLVDYYRADVDQLQILLGREVPWPEFSR